MASASAIAGKSIEADTDVISFISRVCDSTVIPTTLDDLDTKPKTSASDLQLLQQKARLAMKPRLPSVDEVRVFVESHAEFCVFAAHGAANANKNSAAYPIEFPTRASNSSISTELKYPLPTCDMKIVNSVVATRVAKMAAQLLAGVKIDIKWQSQWEMHPRHGDGACWHVCMEWPAPAEASDNADDVKVS